jgi:hypothetical protein
MMELGDGALDLHRLEHDLLGRAALEGPLPVNIS